MNLQIAYFFFSNRVIEIASELYREDFGEDLFPAHDKSSNLTDTQGEYIDHAKAKLRALKKSR